MYPAASYIRIYENINGIKTAHPYGVYPYTAYNGIWYNLKVIANSTTGDLDIYLDDVYLFTHTVITTNRSGQSGVMTSNSGAYLDDFKLTVN